VRDQHLVQSAQGSLKKQTNISIKCRHAGARERETETETRDDEKEMRALAAVVGPTVMRPDALM
jgi:hypothetical protein